MKKEEYSTFPARRATVVAALLVAMAVLLWRVVDLQVYKREFLQREGDVRHLRVVTIPAHRGMITDRHGEALAVSTPVETVWVNPKELDVSDNQYAVKIRRMETLLELNAGTVRKLVGERPDREFAYLRRHVEPQAAQQVMDLGLPGVSLQSEFRRYYPASEVFAHILGFTNVDDVGQEGVELAYDEWLRGAPGAKRVIKDRLGRVVDNVESIREPRPGRDLRLSIDRRIQYLAYRELKAAVTRQGARGGSAVVLDAVTGEVLAAVNQPSYNPNNRKGVSGSRLRNRAVTDTFEPGSTVKPFTIACALESGEYKPESVIDTNPGTLTIAGHTIQDHNNYGVIDVSTVIQKSSNVGASKIALSLPPRCLWSVFKRVGFGLAPGSGFPGEAAGALASYQTWREIHQATLAYGYGLSVSALQLADAYLVLAADGRRLPLSFIKVDEPPKGEKVIDPEIVRSVRAMLERVVAPGGTGTRASVPGYRVAGKTGTAHKTAVGGYAEDRYRSLFAGMAPASKPRLVTVVVIDEPSSGSYYGGMVAAPVFSQIMAGALRLLDVPPDNLPVRQAEARNDKGPA